MEYIKSGDLDFPGTVPLGIGEDYSIVPDEIDVEGTVIKIFSPTDCVKDRLATYVYFNDRDGLDQALLIAGKHPVNYKSIESWCKAEGQTDCYEEFISLMKK